jgi:hypothetical protein
LIALRSTYYTHWLTENKQYLARAPSVENPARRRPLRITYELGLGVSYINISKGTWIWQEDGTFTAVRSGLGSVGALPIMKEDLLENTVKKKSQHAHTVLRRSAYRMVWEQGGANAVQNNLDLTYTTECYGGNTDSAGEGGHTLMAAAHWSIGVVDRCDKRSSHPRRRNTHRCMPVAGECSSDAR